MIDFSRSFNVAWERMVLILFQPFDLGKWFVIGFCAFLAGLLDGGNGFNFSGNGNPGNPSANQQQDPIHHQMTHAAAWFSALQIWAMVMLVALVFVIVFGFIFLFTWLGARGQFMFLDNIVRNRGAVVWPWHAYARLGNQVFLFHLACFAISMGVALVLAVPAILAAVLIIPHHPGFGLWLILGIIAWFLVFLVILVAYAIILSLFHDWGVPLMFRHGIGALAALRETWSLTKRYPGTTALFVLLRIALGIGTIAIALMACCLTCCIELIPYLGTVILLPVLIYIRCFSLECLAQFGPEYSVWTVDQPPGPSGISPLPPLG